MAFVTDVRDATGRACRASDPIRLKAVIDRVIDWAEDAQKGEGGDRKKNASGHRRSDVITAAVGTTQ